MTSLLADFLYNRVVSCLLDLFVLSGEMTEMEHRAMHVAHIAHEGQRYGDEPYFNHVSSVVLMLRQQGFVDPDVLCVAWLHDVLEDSTAYSDEELRTYFGDRIANAVDAITRRQAGPNKESEPSYLARVAADPLAKQVKWADMCHNLLMARSRSCPGNKRNKWQKYLSALKYLAQEGS
jgi:(p)ppGpp synthase/HD superfamily hydrolase